MRISDWSSDVCSSDLTLNKRAFAWGRLAALEPATVAQLAGLPESTHASREIEDETLAEGIARRSADLALYQDAGYADRFRHLMEKVGATTSHLGVAGNAFALAVSRQAYRLMAYTDEYEVARPCKIGKASCRERGG